MRMQAAALLVVVEIVVLEMEMRYLRSDIKSLRNMVAITSDDIITAEKRGVVA